jgi:hypothetical protein
MPGTTPVYGFPYPEPTDLVADYPALGQQLAEDIEDVLPTVGGLAPAAPTSIANSGGSASTTGNTTTFSGVSSISLNGVFNADYNNYRIVLLCGKSTSLNVRFRWRASGTDVTAGNYHFTRSFWFPSTASGDDQSAQSSIQLDSTGAATTILAGDVYVPFLNEASRLLSTFGANGVGIGCAVSQYTVAGVHDGFTIFPSTGNITGTVAVYGYKK